MKQRILYCNVPEEELYDKFPWLEKADFDGAIIIITKKNDINTLSWLNGIWIDGIWWNGIWFGGMWKDGEWCNGTWKHGLWKNGTWHCGIWKDGEWCNGIWKHGLWKNGTWHDGEWCNGVWENGVWHNGKWVDGVWHDGTWHDGEWCNGVWENGVWLNGTELGYRAKYKMSLTIDGEIRIGCKVFTKEQLKKILVDPEDIIDKYFDGNEKAFELQARYLRNLLND